MIKTMIKLGSYALFLSLASCMSTSLVLDQNWKPTVKPTYIDYLDSYWFGFQGQPSISVQKVCMDQKPLAVQRIKTGEDVFLSAITLGIYTPSTVKVWCGE